MKIRTQTTTKNGVKTVRELCPGGWVVIDVYVPHSTPWDYNGMAHCRELKRLLDDRGGIKAIDLKQTDTTLTPYGSGVNGAVRFGDDYLPGVFRLAVKKEDKKTAIAIITEYRKQVSDWIENGIPRPKLYNY